MKKMTSFTKILVIIGTMLVWIPIIAPVLIFIVTIIKRSIFIFDYLMPLELFPIALVGGGLLIWATFRILSYRKLIIWGLVITIGLRIGLELLVVVNRRFWSEAIPDSWWNLIVVAWAVIYSLCLIVIGIGGILMLIKLFRPSK